MKLIYDKKFKCKQQELHKTLHGDAICSVYIHILDTRITLHAEYSHYFASLRGKLFSLKTVFVKLVSRVKTAE